METTTASQSLRETTATGASPYRRLVERLLERADIHINGDRPWDLQVHDEAFFARVMAGGSLAAGESYMEGCWDCEQLDEFFARVTRVGLDIDIQPWREGLLFARAFLMNLQNRRRAFHVGRHHYDLGNAFYQRLLDPLMLYSCAYWRRATTLAEAQEHKVELIARKLGLEPGMRVLDVGCGWGGAAKYMARRHGVEVVGITISKQQALCARKMCEGLPVEIRIQDYRELNEPFDRIYSIGMFEHVGWRNYRTYLEVVRRCLADDGLFVLHTIGGNRSVHYQDPWIDRYIFPNSLIPSAAQITAASLGQFVIEDWHNFGTDYDRTLMAWWDNFEAAWPDFQAEDARYDKTFRRMWRYYLLGCAGSFRARKNQLWQIVLSPQGVPGGYEAPR